MGGGEEEFAFENFREKEALKQEIDALWAWLIEKSYEDPTGAQTARQQLSQNLQKLGVVDPNGQLNIKLWTDFVTTQAQRKSTPVTPKDYPIYETFEEKYLELLKQKPELELLHRHTDNIPKYLYGLGMVMSDKVVYKSIFQNDDITIKNGEVENGKHREATREILNMCGFIKQMPWIIVSYED